MPRARSLRAQAWLPFAALISALALGACTVGPDYHAEAAPTPTAYKELKGWKVATPAEGPGGGDWWALYRDAALDTLIKQVEISNQNVAVQAAAYEQARAVIRQAQASLFPLLTASYSATEQHFGSARAAGGASSVSGVVSRSGYVQTYNPALNGTWDLDIWGKVRRQIESNTSAAQASAADLAYVKLSQQALLATAYFNLRTADALRDLLDRTVAIYRESQRITQDKVNAGCCVAPLQPVSPADLALAKALVETTQAQAINVGVQRAQYEHAIAMLIGRPPAELTVAHRSLGRGPIPNIPVAVPSSLLERRPDIAQAERTMQQYNALIGVAIAGYFPDISLSGSLEWIGNHPLPFNVASEIWSLGASGTQILFNGGLTGAQVDQARAQYWQFVATYRQTVLTAFQGVEDQLAAIRILTRQLVVVHKAVVDARDAVRIYQDQYRAGTVDFTTVITGEAQLLVDEEAELTVRQNLFLASVNLIEDLGGGWDTNLLPKQNELVKGFSLLPQL